MTHRVTISPSTVDQALDFKHELLSLGLIMGVDFEWQWHPPVYDMWSMDAKEPGYVHFELLDPSLATFFQLKWRPDN